MRARLGIAPKSARGIRKCACGRGTDTSIYHAEVCSKNYGPSNRHNEVVRRLAQAFQEAGFLVQVEPKDAFINPPDGRHGDLLVNGFMGSDLLIDVSVVHPGKNVKRSANVPGWAMKDRDRLKRDHYQELCRTNHLYFIPFIMDAYGAIEGHALTLLKKLATELAKENRNKPPWVPPNLATSHASLPALPELREVFTRLPSKI